MSISGVSTGSYYPGQTASSQTAGVREEQKTLVDALREERDSQPDLVEMMKEAREKAAERAEALKLPKNSRRYGDAPMIAYSKLARARTVGDVDAASGYARRQIAQLRAAKRSDDDNADRIQAAINQLQKAVNRGGRKKRELNQEKLTAKRQAKLEKEKRTREAKRLRHQLKGRRAMRVIRESGYLREAEVDNRFQDQIAASKLEMRNQMQELMDKTQVSVETAVQQYTAAVSSVEAASVPEISVQA